MNRSFFFLFVRAYAKLLDYRRSWHRRALSYRTSTNEITNRCENSTLCSSADEVGAFIDTKFHSSLFHSYLNLCKRNSKRRRNKFYIFVRMYRRCIVQRFWLFFHGTCTETHNIEIIWTCIGNLIGLATFFLSFFVWFDILRTLKDISSLHKIRKNCYRYARFLVRILC